jgi:hypothetical protein
LQVVSEAINQSKEKLEKLIGLFKPKPDIPEKEGVCLLENKSTH